MSISFSSTNSSPISSTSSFFYPVSSGSPLGLTRLSHLPTLFGNNTTPPVQTISSPDVKKVISHPTPPLSSNQFSGRINQSPGFHPLDISTIKIDNTYANHTSIDIPKIILPPVVKLPDENSPHVSSTVITHWVSQLQSSRLNTTSSINHTVPNLTLSTRHSFPPTHQHISHTNLIGNLRGQSPNLSTTIKEQLSVPSKSPLPSIGIEPSDTSLCNSSHQSNLIRLPSYETMLVEALHHLQNLSKQSNISDQPYLGSNAKEIFSVMSSMYPNLPPRFRDSASVCLKRAVRKGIIRQYFGLHSINPTYLGSIAKGRRKGHTNNRKGMFNIPSQWDNTNDSIVSTNPPKHTHESVLSITSPVWSTQNNTISLPSVSNRNVITTAPSVSSYPPTIMAQPQFTTAESESLQLNSCLPLTDSLYSGNSSVKYNSTTFSLSSPLSLSSLDSSIQPLESSMQPYSYTNSNEYISTTIDPSQINDIFLRPLFTTSTSTESSDTKFTSLNYPVSPSSPNGGNDRLLPNLVTHTHTLLSPPLTPLTYNNNVNGQPSSSSNFNTTNMTSSSSPALTYDTLMCWKPIF